MPTTAASWNEGVNARTRDYLSLTDVSLPLDLTVRAQHKDGRSGQLSVRALSENGSDVTLRLGGEEQHFPSVNALVEAGWAVSGRTIQPWEGKHYGTPANLFGGLKVLVLGESTHAEEHAIGEARDHLTQQTVHMFLNEGGENWQFYQRVTAVLAGACEAGLPDHSKHPPSRTEIWDSIAFANVVPVVAANYPKERPAKKIFHLCSPYLEEIFDRLKPDVAMVFGKEAWGWFNWSLVYNRMKWDQPAGFVQSHGAFCGSVRHPAAGMSISEAQTTLKSLLDAARERQMHQSQDPAPIG